MNPGDIVQTPQGGYWRLIHVERTIVRAERIDTGVVSQLDRSTLTVTEPHPGGPR